MLNWSSTGFFSVFGEILPKVFAQGANVAVATAFAQPLAILRWLVYPLSHILIRTSNRIGERLSQQGNELSIEDLADAVDMTTASSSEEQKILSGIVNFATREVEEIMRPRMDIVAVELTMSFESTGLSDVDRQKLLGEEAYGTTGQWESDNETPWGGFGYIRRMRDNGVKSFEAWIVLKIKFQEESQTTATREGSIQWNTPTLNGRAAGLYVTRAR